MDNLIQFYSVRLSLILASVSAQLYIFFNVRAAVLSSGKSERFKSLALWTTGCAMASLTLTFWFTAVNPVLLSNPPEALQAALFYLPALWNIGSIFSAAIIFMFQAIRFAGNALFGGRDEKRPGNTPREINSPERRSFIGAGIGGLAAVPFAVFGYGAFFEAKRFGVRDISIPFGRSLKVVQMSDIHSGHFMTRAEIRQCVEKVKALEPDLFLLTGDYISNSMKFLAGCLEELSRVRARYGTFACLGNHEHWHAKTDYLFAAFERHGIRLLVNSHEIIQTEEGPLAVLGIPDLLRGNASLETALSGIAPAVPKILLSHRPEIFPSAAEKGIKLTLAGHYHGGQIVFNLPGISLNIADFKTDYPQGFFRLKDSYLYVSRGIGTTFTPVRLNAEPEITLLNLH